MSAYVVLRMVYLSALLLTCIFAWVRGGKVEMIGVSIIAFGSLLPVVLEELALFDWRAGRSGLVVIDMAALIAFFVLALRTDRFWPLWVTAFHLIAVSTHLVVVLQPGRILQAYAIAQGFWAYPMLLAIVMGCFRRPPHLHKAPKRLTQTL